MVTTIIAINITFNLTMVVGTSRDFAIALQGPSKGGATAPVARPADPPAGQPGGSHQDGAQ